MGNNLSSDCEINSHQLRRVRKVVGAGEEIKVLFVKKIGIMNE